LYYSCLIKIYKFSRRNSLKSASLYRGGLVDAAVVGLVEAAVVGLVDAAVVGMVDAAVVGLVVSIFSRICIFV
jgi:hypothetical protein